MLDEHTNFFADYGITYETAEFAAGINTIDALTIGQLDIGLFADYAGVNRIGNTVSETQEVGKTKITVAYSNECSLKDKGLDCKFCNINNLYSLYNRSDLGGVFC